MITDDRAGSGGDDPLLDEDILTEMRAAVRPGEFAAILTVFVEDTVERMARLRLLHAEARWPDLADECHDLSSTLGTFGASGPMAVAREAMDAARLGDRDRLDRLMPRLLDRTARMADLLRTRVAEGAESVLPGHPTGP